MSNANGVPIERAHTVPEQRRASSSCPAPLWQGRDTPNTSRLAPRASRLRDRRRAGAFTLVEAIASVLLIAVGLVVGQQCLNAITAGRVRALDTEEMQRLAFRKYDEILAEGKLLGGQSSGDFAEIGERRLSWKADRSAIGSGNLDRLRIQVSRDDGLSTQIEGLVCPPKKEAS